jgi:hypothetical protein
MSASFPVISDDTLQHSHNNKTTTKKNEKNREREVKESVNITIGENGRTAPSQLYCV